MNSNEVLAAILAHASSGGTLNPTSPLLVAAREAIAAPVAAQKFTESQLAQRRLTLGASDVAAAIGVSPYATPHNVWSSKMGLADFAGNDATEAGNDFEAIILARTARHNEIALLPSRHVIGPEPWMSATPDAFVRGGGIVETKMVGFESAWQWGSESDGIPMHYLVQVQWQLLVTGEPFCIVGAQLGTRHTYYRIEPDTELQAMMVERARAFWFGHVVTKKHPAIDGSEGAREMLALLYPRSGPAPIAADSKLDTLAEKLAKARLAVDAAETAKRRAENEMKEAVGDASGAYGATWKLSWKTTKTGTRTFRFEDMTKKKAKEAA